jgi:hypothetical protein
MKMKGKFGKKEASQNGKISPVIMIVCVFTMILFIGTAVQPAIATTFTNQEFETRNNHEDCPLCAPRADIPNNNPNCKTCKEAVSYAVEYMKDYVKEKLKDVNETYFLWTLDMALLMSKGILIGFQKSGFEIKVDTEELNENIVYWVNKTVGPQMFNVTILLAKLGAISFGITSYLLTLCNGDSSKKLPSFSGKTWSIFVIMPRFFRWIWAFHNEGNFN